MFAGQYQQRPLLGGSGICDISRIRRYDTPPAFELTIHSWDLGATTGRQSHGLHQMGRGARTRPRRRLLPDRPDPHQDGIARRARAIKAQDKLDKPDLIVIDGLGIGIGIYQELRGAAIATSTQQTTSPNSQKAGKIERFTKALLWIYDQKVALPKAAPYLDVLLAEMAAFPEAATDDQVDSISQVLARPNVRCCMPAKSIGPPTSERVTMTAG